MTHLLKICSGEACMADQAGVADQGVIPLKTDSSMCRKDCSISQAEGLIGQHSITKAGTMMKPVSLGILGLPAVHSDWSALHCISHFSPHKKKCIQCYTCHCSSKQCCGKINGATMVYGSSTGGLATHWAGKGSHKAYAELELTCK